MSVVAYRLLLVSVFSRGRVIALGALAGLMLFVAGVVRFLNAPRDVISTLASEAGLGIAVPIVALVIAVGVFGDLTEDGTLGYLWLRPVARWRLTLAGLLAAVSLSVPVTAAVLALAVVVGGAPSLAWPTFVAAGLAGVAYATPFVGIGLLSTRALLYGLVYLFIYENILARAAPAFAVLSVRRYAASLLDRFGDLEGTRFGVDPGPAFLGLAVVTLLGAALTHWLFVRREVA